MLCVVPVLLFCIVLSELLEQPKQLKECSPETVLGIFSDQLPPANEVWGKVIFSEASVKNSVHRGWGGGVWSGGVPASRGLSGSGGVPARGGGGSGLGGLVLGVCAWSRGGGLVETPGRLLLRVVRILLECILVHWYVLQICPMYDQHRLIL